MNTISINASSLPLVWRFAWKEYRMLRGFWIAGLGIALSIQVLAHVDVLRVGALAPGWYMMVAWSAAALYSVGAAITIFCAETEERTRDYLRLLPGDWSAIFASKVLTALATAIALGGALSLTGCWLAGSLPPQQHVISVMGIAGVAVLEFFAWGLLFSLWWKHPLLAAVAAIAAASFGAQWAIVATADVNNSWTGEAYAAAVPGRLAICLVVFAVDVWLGRRWLYPTPTTIRAVKAQVVAKPASGVKARPRVRMFGRLLWQTWRESWLAILVAVPLSIALVVALLLPAYLQSMTRFIWWLPYGALIAPALLGALAFRADQKSDHRLFLAAHAAWPRYVWLARQLVWFTVALSMGLVAHYVYWQWLIDLLRSQAKGYSIENWTWFSWIDSDYRETEQSDVQAWRMDFLLRAYLRGILTAWCAIISAYGVGQLCSMLLKQSLLSGFLAILLAIAITAWSVLMYLWEMSPLMFVLPIGLATLLATWFIIPNWMLQKNSWKHWIRPIAAVVMPLVVMVSMVPTVRQWQVENPNESYTFLREPLENSLERFRDSEQRQQQTKLDLERVPLKPSWSIEEVTVDGKLLKDHELADRALEFYYSGHMETTASESLSPEDLEILKQFDEAQQQQFYEENREAIPELVEVLNRPDAALPFGDHYYRTQFHDSVEEFSLLLAKDAERLTKEGKLDEAWQRLLAIVPLTPRLGWDASTGTNRISLLGVEDLYKAVINWATQSDQTSERLKQAIVDLEQRFAELPTPSDRIIAYRNHVKEILDGQEVPRNFGNSQYYFLGSLPGEQKRALTALDRFALQALNYAAAVEQIVQPKSRRLSSVYGFDNVRDLLRAAPRRMIFVNNHMVARGDRASAHANNIAATSATSFLVAEQFGTSGELGWLLKNWVADEANRRALLVQLALIAYKLDPGKYPETLTELTPAYLPYGVVDPYSGRPFRYEPKGLEYYLKHYVDLPAHTPLLWSVGIGNMHLMKVEEPEFTEFFPTETAPDAEFGGGYYGQPAGTEPYEASAASRPGKVYFTFEETERLLRGGMYTSPERLVFPIPKIAGGETR